MKARKSDLVALGFLLAAVVAFGLYQGLVESRVYDPTMGPDVVLEETRGYEVWLVIYGAYQAGYLDDFYRFVIMGLFLGVVVTLVSPFLLSALGRSRPLWWVGVCCSAMAVIAVCGGILWLEFLAGWEPSPEYGNGPGYYFCLAFPVLNFIGLLCIRRQH